MNKEQLEEVIEYIRDTGRKEKRKEISPFFLSIMEKVLSPEEYREWREVVYPSQLAVKTEKVVYYPMQMYDINGCRQMCMTFTDKDGTNYVFIDKELENEGEE